MSIHKAAPEHEVAYQDLVALIGKHADKVSAQELLAIAGNLIGKLIAMQDQRMMTRKIALEIVAENIMSGNKQVLDIISSTAGNA